MQRKYDYDYDAANRLIRANFLQKDNFSAAWTNTNFDFTVSGGVNNKIDYDANGNLVLDENKAIKNLVGTKGVIYNYLDKVDQVKITGKGTTKFIYDAAGNKLQKIFTPITGAAKTLSYIDKYVYEGDELQFINMEEGRLRRITKTLFPKQLRPQAAAKGFGIGLAASYLATEVNWGNVGNGIMNWAKHLFDSKTLWMYYDVTKILQTYQTYYEEDIITDKSKTPWVRKPKKGVESILEVHLVQGILHFEDEGTTYNFTANSGYNQNGATPDGDYTMSNFRIRTEQGFNFDFPDNNKGGFSVDMTPDPNQGIERGSIETHPT